MAFHSIRWMGAFVSVFASIAQGASGFPPPSCDCPNCAAIPTVSEWGLVVMTLLALSVGTVLFGRRQRVGVHGRI